MPESPILEELRARNGGMITCPARPGIGCVGDDAAIARDRVALPPLLSHHRGGT